MYLLQECLYLQEKFYPQYMNKAPIIGIVRHRIPIDGDGVTTLVAFSHCPLRCVYCLNAQCEDPKAVKFKITPQELVDKVAIDNLYFLATGGGVTFGGGEPAIRSEYIADFKSVAIEGWKINIETSLNVDRKHIERLLPIIDQWIIDIKDMHADIYEKYTSLTNARVLENLRYLVDHGVGSKCTIRIPLIPNYNNEELQSDSEKILKGMGFFSLEKFNYVIK